MDEQDKPKTYKAADVTIHVGGEVIVGLPPCDVKRDVAATPQAKLRQLRDKLVDAINPIIDAADPALLPDRCLIVADVSRAHKTTFMQFYDAKPATAKNRGDQCASR